MNGKVTEAAGQRNRQRNITNIRAKDKKRITAQGDWAAMVEKRKGNRELHAHVFHKLPFEELGFVFLSTLGLVSVLLQPRIVLRKHALFQCELFGFLLLPHVDRQTTEYHDDVSIPKANKKRSLVIDVLRSGSGSARIAARHTLPSVLALSSQ